MKIDHRFVLITLLILFNKEIVFAQCPPATNTTCMPAPFINATYSPGYACKDDGRTVAEIINWNGSFGSGPNANGTEAVVFMVMCNNALPVPAPGQLGVYWTSFSQPGKLELNDVVGDYINCNGNWQIGANTCVGQICLYPVTVYAISGNTGCYDPTCFAAAPPVCIQLSAACANPNANPNPVCDGQTTTLNANGSPAGSTYQWSNGLGNTATVNAMPMGTTTYTVTVTSSVLPTCTIEEEVTVNTLPNVTTILNPIGPLCLNTSPPPLPNASANTPPIQGTWSPSVISTNAPGTFTYTFTPNQGQCGTIEQINITILENIVPIVGPFGPYCINAIPDVLPTSSNNMPPINGTWNPAVISTSTPGTTTYTFTPDGSSGCTVPTPINITVNAEITPTFAPLGPICINKVAPVLPTSSNNTPPITGTWNPAVINTSTAGTFVYTFTPDANQCATTTTMSITITPEIAPTFTPVSSLCQGITPPTLPNNSNNSPPIMGTWSPNIINTSTPGTTIYTFTPDISECASIFTMEILVNPNLTPNFNPIGPLCLNSSPPTLPLTSTDGITGTWSPATINTNSVGVTTYTFTGTSAPCAQSTIQIEILPNLIPTFNALGPYCLNDVPDNLNNTSLNGIDGTWSPATINTSNAGNTVYTFTPNAGECGVSTTMSIVVNNPITPIFTINNNYCQNSSPDNLPTTSNNGITGTWSPPSINTSLIGQNTYTFTPNNNQCASPLNINVDVVMPTVPTFSTSSLSFCQNTTPTTLPLISLNGISGTWSPSVISTSVIGTTIYTFTPTTPQCAIQQTISVEVTAPPSPTFNLILPLCQNEMAPLLPSSSLEGIMGTWSPAIINTTTSGNFTFTFTPTPGSCGTTSAISVTILSSPNAVNTNVIAANCGQSDGSVTINNVTGGSAPYEYNFNNTGFSTNNVFQNLAANTYSLIIIDANGCAFNTFVNVSNTSGPTNVSFNTSPETCFNINGTLTITGVTGGNVPYEYSFDGSSFSTTNVYNGIAAGNYPIAVSDANGCIFNTVVQIINIPGPTGISITTSDASCGMANGTISLGSVDGGVAPYQYSVNGSIFSSSLSYTGFVGGVYDIIVRDVNGCEFTTTTSVSDVPGPTAIIANISNATCAQSDGNITVSQVTGGIAPYLFSFNNAAFSSTNVFSNLASGSYLLIVKDAGGCEMDTIINVGNINGPTNIDVSIKHTSCGQSNGSINILGVGGNSGPYSYSLNGSAFSPETNYAELPSGTYIITAKDNNNCTLSITNVINPSSGIDSLFTTIINSNCGINNGQIKIDSIKGGTAPYSYSFNGSSFAKKISFENLATGTFYIIAKDTLNCVDTSFYKIVNPAGPQDFEIISTNETCSDKNGTITINNIIGGTPLYMYSLDGNTFQNQNTFSDLTAGQYTVYVKDANDCKVNKSVNILNISGPSNITLSTTQTNCGQSNGTVTITNVSGGTAPYEYSFNGLPFDVLTIFQNLSAGVYPISIKDATGCVLTQDATVNNNGGPTDFIVDVIDPKCGLSNGVITIANVINGLPPYQYSLNNGTYTNTMTFSSVAPGNQTVTVRDANGCIYSKPIVLMDTGNFIATISKTDPSCGLNNGSISVTPSANGYAYNWNFGISGSSPQNLGSGNYIVTITQVASGCEQILNITLNPSNALSISCTPSNVTTQNGSDGQNTINIANGLPPYVVNWAGSSIGNLSNQQNSNVTIQNLKSGNYIVTVTDGIGCTATCNFDIKDVDCLLTVQAKGSNTSCFGSADGKIETTINFANGNPTIVWSNPLWNNLTNINNALPGSYTVTVTDAANCTAVESVLIGQPQELRMECTVTNVTEQGLNDGIGTIIISGGTGNYRVIWSGPQSGNQGNISAGSFQIKNLAPGTYQIKVIDNNNCEQICGFTVAESKCNLKLDINKKQIVCHGDCNGALEITTAGANGMTNITWNNAQYNDLFKIANLCSGTYSGTVTDSENCTSIFTTTIDNPENWSISLTADRSSLFINETTKLNLVSSLSPEKIENILWKTDSQLSCLDCPNPNVKISDNTVFEVTVTDTLGCQKSASITITVREIFEVYLPNIININSQNGNSIFFPKGDPDKINVIKKMKIFDRWGNLIFLAENIPPNDPNVGWNGSFSGSKVAQGVYVFVVEAEFKDGSIKIIKGNLTVIE